MSELDKEIRSWARLAKKHEYDDRRGRFYQGGVAALRHFKQRIRAARATPQEEKP